MKKKVLIINRCKSSNLGDQLIGLSTVSLFEKYGYSVDNVDLVTSSDNRKLKLRSYKKKKSKNIFTLLRKIYSNKIIKRIIWYVKNRNIFSILLKKKYDLVIIGGGELIQSNLIFPIAMNLWVKNIRKTHKDIPIIFFSIGVSNNIKNFDKYLLKKSLEQANRIYVRDHSSYKNLAETFGIKAKTVPDVVFSLNFPTNSNSQNRFLYGITLFKRIARHSNIFSSKEEYFNYVLEELKQIEKKGKVFIIYSNPEDYNACLEFLEYAYEKRGVKYNFIEYQTLTEFIELIQSSDAIISPRMHTLILGLLCHKQVHPMCISEKISTFKTMYLEGKNTTEALEQIKDLNKKINKVVEDIIKEQNYGT